ncbi:MAG TPA: hypothetical protein VFZ73_05870, partial [Gemmatimonadaceae bacterium]
WDTASAFDSQRSQIHHLYLPASLFVRLQAAEQLRRATDRATIETRLRALGRQDLLTRAGAT